MEPLTCALLCALFTCACPRPAGQVHQDADILSSDLDHDWITLEMRSLYTAHLSSSESQCSKESSEELEIIQPSPTEPTPATSSAFPTGVPIAMTASEVFTGTDLHTVDNTTVLEPCLTTGCVTVNIPMSSVVTASRGDN